MTGPGRIRSLERACQDNDSAGFDPNLIYIEVLTVGCRSRNMYEVVDVETGLPVKSDLIEESEEEIINAIRNNVKNNPILSDFVSKASTDSEIADMPFSCIVSLAPFDISIISDDFVIEAFKKQHVGDAELFKILMEGRYIRDHSTANLQGEFGQFYRWDNHSWTPDRDFSIMSQFTPLQELYNRVSEKYNSLAQDLSNKIDDLEKEEKKTPNVSNRNFSDEIKKFRVLIGSYETAAKSFKTRGQDVLKRPRMIHILNQACSGGMGVPTDKWNNQPEFLPCLNGTVNLRTGELMEPDPEHYFNKVVPWEFKGLDEPCPKWDAVLSQCLTGDLELISYFSACIGQAVTGFQSKDLFCAYGPSASNGKTMIFETLHKLLGCFSTHLSVLHLLKQGPKTAGAPQAELAELRGVRMAIAAEPGDKEYLDLGQVKLLTSGGDLLKTRAPYAVRSIEFIQSHSLFLHCNTIPRSSSGDKGLANRLRIIPFEARFIDPASGPEDPTNHIYHQINSTVLGKALEQEMSGILAWAVRGAIEVLENGLPKCPQRVVEETEEYIMDNDVISQFLLAECVKDIQAAIEAKILYGAFEQFCQKSLLLKDNRILSMKNFGLRMNAFCRKKRTSKHILYLGIRLIKDNSPCFIDISDYKS